MRKEVKVKEEKVARKIFDERFCKEKSLLIFLKIIFIFLKLHDINKMILKIKNKKYKSKNMIKIICILQSLGFDP